MHRQMLKSKIHYSPAVVHVNDDNDLVAIDSDPTVLLGGVSPDQEALL